MARRNRQGGLEFWIEVAAKLSWKVCLLLAVLSYAVMHMIAGIRLEGPVNMANMGNYAIKQRGIILAMFGQVLLPFVFLSGAIVSFFRQRKNKQLYDSIAVHSPEETKSTALQAVERLTWQEFEMLVGESFRRKGYSVQETGGGGADGGIDLEMSLNGQKYLVQCKQWKTFKVGVNVVREFFGVMVAKGATGGFVVTSGVFTEEAVSFAEGKRLTLIDGAKLLKMINAAQTTTASAKSNGPSLWPSEANEPKTETASPLCPRCNKAMVKRTAKQGANAGKEFWGCSQYPKCKGIVNIGK